MSAWPERQGQVRRLPGSRTERSTSTQTATVEVLTAQVRVLQVGSRQVTLSVYRQLDHVNPAEIEPFGRVKDRDDDHRMICVIGRSTRPVDHGALVRSEVPMAGHIKDRLYLGARWQAVLADPYGRQQAALMAAAWEALPLIVLAGLR
jgi:hypothetical protein